jgi:peroxiredoxin
MKNQTLLLSLCLLAFAGTVAVAAQMAPPPMLKSEAPAEGGMPKGGVDAGTPAPDGLGVTMARAATAGDYNPALMTYVPWKDASVIKPLSVGAKMPAGSRVLTMAGKPFDLTAAVANKSTVLMFYRGGWCPYCNAHLRELQKSVGALRDMGYQLLAISTDTPEALRATDANGELGYQLLSDSKLAVAATFGLKYQLVQPYIDHVKSKPDTRAALAHVDLQERNGGYMLTPGAFILDKSGTIRFVYVNNNYSVRISQDALLKAAREALR